MVIKIIFTLLLIISLVTNIAPAQENRRSAITTPVSTSQLVEYDHYPAIVQQLITKSRALTEQDLTYQYGSANPKNGGMDCSGTIYYLLQQFGVKDAPRSSHEMYTWAKNNGKLYFTGSNNFDASEFSNLKPGDLLFWSGTYHVKHNPPITHVMLYLGKDAQGRHLMFGSSDGRTYKGKQMWGVSLFDFLLPNGNSSSHFEGYSCIPHLTCN